MRFLPIFRKSFFEGIELIGSMVVADRLGQQIDAPTAGRACARERLRKRVVLGLPSAYRDAQENFVQKFIALLLCFAISTATTTAFAGEPANTYKVTYDGGSLLGVKAGESAKLSIEAKQIRILRGKDVELVSIPVDAVTEISYGQDVHRRIGAAIGVAIFTLGIGALLALTKSKKHFVGLTWADGDKKGGFAMQCDKNEYRGILNGLEGVTGKKAIDSEAMTVKN